MEKLFIAILDRIKIPGESNQKYNFTLGQFGKFWLIFRATFGSLNESAEGQKMVLNGPKRAKKGKKGL